MYLAMAYACALTTVLRYLSPLCVCGMLAPHAPRPAGAPRACGRCV